MYSLRAEYSSLTSLFLHIIADYDAVHLPHICFFSPHEKTLVGLKSEQDQFTQLSLRNKLASLDIVDHPGSTHFQPAAQKPGTLATMQIRRTTLQRATSCCKALKVYSNATFVLSAQALQGNLH